MKKITKAVLILSIVLASNNITYTQIISTVAGNGSGGSSGDGGSATNATLALTFGGLGIDNFGNIYIGDGANNRLREVTFSTSIINIIAGNGTPGFSGDGGLAVNSKVSCPSEVHFDASGNIYFSDVFNHRIRKITKSTGNISTVAGSSTTSGYSGDGGQATSAMFNSPYGFFIDASGNIYISDYSNNRIRKVTASTGIITTIAGTGTAGYSGDGGVATNAEINKPNGICLDASGNVYFSDKGNNRIRKITISTGIISTIAGYTTTVGYSGDGGAAINAQLNTPLGICIDASDNLYIADYGNNVVRKITSSGIISTIVGNGTAGYSGDGGSAINAQLYYPRGVFLSASGDLYIADAGNHVIRKITNVASAISENSATDNINIYPNPSSHSINITGIEVKTTLKVQDAFGKLVLQKEIEDNTILNTSELENGVYFLILMNNNGNTTTKIIIHK